MPGPPDGVTMRTDVPLSRDITSRISRAKIVYLDDAGNELLWIAMEQPVQAGDIITATVPGPDDIDISVS